MSNRLIIIPTYNESLNAPILIERIFRYIPAVSLLVIDDGSPDGTAQVIKELQEKFPTL
ncbi:MAG: glycosyltransferase, partial [Actinobacteria bacterium]|nr:glycosyltransferase [Actinomycetota bacterium]